MSNREVATVCVDCGSALPAPRHGAGPKRCVACFHRELVDAERGFLDHYSEFGSLSHRVVAENAARGLVMGSPGERKILALSVFDEFLRAAADLIGLYHALKSRRERPVVQSVMEFSLDPQRTREFFRDLAALDDEELMAHVGLPRPERIASLFPGWDGDDLKFAAVALWRAMHGLREVTTDGTLTEVNLVAALLHHRSGGPAAGRTDWTNDIDLSPGQVALLYVDPVRRELAAERFSAGEAEVNRALAAIDAVSRATSDLAYAYALLHHPDLDAPVRLQRGA